MEGLAKLAISMGLVVLCVDVSSATRSTSINLTTLLARADEMIEYSFAAVHEFPLRSRPRNDRIDTPYSPRYARRISGFAASMLGDPSVNTRPSAKT